MKLDPILTLVVLVFGLPVVLALGYLLYLLGSVLFGGGGTACPQNLC